MNGSLDIWKMVAGVGFFLYGMMQLEQVIQKIAGKKFKFFLKKYTTNRFFAIINGFFAAAILQSSSIVLLLVIAFAGAGIISLSNSLGIILGANLGTTVTGWVVSAIGFKMNMQALIYPMIGIGSLGLIFVSRRLVFFHFFSFVIAVGFIFMGLDLTKRSFLEFAPSLDLHLFLQYGAWSFFLIGFLMTAAIQSSSAMMTITLSALFAQVITLESAAFVVVGADLGTSVPALISAMKGAAVKKRVGLAHFFFNVGTAFAALILLKPLFQFIQEFLNVTDPLFALVAFHSSFNLLGVLIFLPLLGVFDRFLNRFFSDDGQAACRYIHRVSVEVPEASLEAIRLELHNFIGKVSEFNTGLIGFSFEEPGLRPSKSRLLQIFSTTEDVFQKYEQIKKIEAELLEYFRLLQKENLDPAESGALGQYILALRNGVQSAKNIKDIQHNLNDLRQSVKKIDEEMNAEISRQYSGIYFDLRQILSVPFKRDLTEDLNEIANKNERSHQGLNNWIYLTASSETKNSSLVPTFLNVSRELYSATGLFIDAIRSAQFELNSTGMPVKRL